jgi:mono/diheme cytochrome c family protein
MNHVRNISVTAVIAILLALSNQMALAADERVVTYVDHVRPILQQYCLKCHGNDEQNADLNMQSYATLMAGGSAGSVVKAGRPAASILYQAITNKDESARMPPKSPPLPAEKIAVINAWIETGLRESASSKALSTQQTLTFTPQANAAMKPEGLAAMPPKLPALEVTATRRPLGILALATSPWAPLAAASGYEHIRLFNTETEEEIGKLPYPDGIPHVLKFSLNGAVLLAAGGKPGHSGSLRLYDVKSGSVMGKFGDELDTVIAAGISPDQKIVALGGPGRVVKAYSTENGKEVYRITRHTDWVTAIAFSPDGKQIATGDRAGNLYLSSANGGGILLSLANHKGAVRSLAWRSDSRLLASAGDDGRLIWWNTETGFVAMQNTSPHPPSRPQGFTGKLPNGVLSVAFRRDGLVVSTGRDNHIRAWKTNSQQPYSMPLSSGTPIQVAVGHKGKKHIVGDSLGVVHFWTIDK